MLRCLTVWDHQSSENSFLFLVVPGTSPCSGRMDVGRYRHCERHSWDGQTELDTLCVCVNPVLWSLCTVLVLCMFLCALNNTSVWCSGCLRDTTSQTKLCTVVLLHPNTEKYTAVKIKVQLALIKPYRFTFLFILITDLSLGRESLLVKDTLQNILQQQCLLYWITWGESPPSSLIFIWG